MDWLQHWQQVHRIAGLVADADGHDDLVCAIDGSLSVVGLNPAVRSLEDVAIGVREIPLDLRFGVTSCNGWQRPLLHH